MEHVLSSVSGFLQSLGLEVLFLQVFILAFLAAFPIGPLAMMALQETNMHGKKHGLKIALCATLGDTLIAFVSAFTFMAVLNFIQDNQNGVYLAISVLLIFCGLYFLISPKIQSRGKFNVFYKVRQNKKALYTFSFLWSAFYPGNIIIYMMICFTLAGLGHSFSEISIFFEYIVPLFLGTWLIWSLWVLIGAKLKKSVPIFIKTFAVAFIAIGLNLLLTRVI